MPDGVTIKMVDLGGIAVSDRRLRKLRPAVVDQLAESILSQGLLQPIRLMPRGRNNNNVGYVLIAGRHRLEAVRQLHKRKLGPDSIRAEIVDDSNADAALLAEIDENLVRAELSTIERALHTAKRKELYEARHPETKTGKAPGKAGGGKKAKSAKLATFVNDAARKTGKGRRTIARDAARGNLDGIGEAIGTSLDKGEELDHLVKLPADRRDALIARARSGEKVSAKLESKKVRREQREQKFAGKTLALPNKKYGVVLEDYEWDHETWSEKGRNRHADNHYETSTDAHTAEEIVERTRDRFKCAADNCVLWMWTTTAHSAIAHEVMRLRGFTYKSQIAWDKEVAAHGRWSMNQHEILLIGTRGEVPCPAPGTLWSSVIRERKREHSRKPEASYRMIEAYFPNVPKIELNAREGRKGWDCWEFEAPEAAE